MAPVSQYNDFIAHPQVIQLITSMVLQSAQTKLVPWSEIRLFKANKWCPEEILNIQYTFHKIYLFVANTY